MLDGERRGASFADAFSSAVLDAVGRFQKQDGISRIPAVDQFDEVLTLTKDPFLLFLAHFLTGMAREHDGDRANAIASYRAALELKPRAQSASFALGSLLFLGGERDQAAKLINAGTLPPAADDPWRTYQAGDFRFWNERLEALRRELR